MFKHSRKPTSKEGAHCSIIRSTAVKSEHHINLNSCESTTNYEWSQSTNRDLNNFSPIYAANTLTMTLFRIKKYSDEEDEVTLTNIISDRTKTLPINNGYLNNSHTLINRERMSRNILPLYRVSQLDELATEQAKIMAGLQCRGHSDLEVLMPKIIESGPCRRVGENVCRETSVQFIHKKMMHSPKCAADKNNILDRRYSSFGVGVSSCVNGILYVCQIYKG